MKKTIGIVLGVIVGIFSATYLVDAVFTKQAVDEIERRATTTNSQPLLSEAEAKQEFTSGCLQSGYGIDGIESYCSCLYTQLRLTYSINQLANMGLTYSESEIEQAMSNQVAYCARTTWGVDLL